MYAISLPVLRTKMTGQIWKQKWLGLGSDVPVLKISFGRQSDLKHNALGFICYDIKFPYYTGACRTDSSAH